MNELENWLKTLFILNKICLDNSIEYEEDDESTCEIIDIADEEMKRIDSSEIDTEFKKAFKTQSTQNLINLIAADRCTQEDLDVYLDTLGDNDILDLRLEGQKLYIKTKGGIIPLILANIMMVDEEWIERVPVFGKYNFYFIDAKERANIEENQEPTYDPEELVDILQDIASSFDYNIHLLSKLVHRAFNQGWQEDIDFNITVEVEDKVVAIALSRYIPDAKDVISEILFINPDLFIEVSSPIGTVLLIDTRRWYLEPDFGDDQWFH